MPYVGWDQAIDPETQEIFHTLGKGIAVKFIMPETGRITLLGRYNTFPGGDPTHAYRPATQQMVIIVGDDPTTSQVGKITPAIPVPTEGWLDHTLPEPIIVKGGLPIWIVYANQNGDEPPGPYTNNDGRFMVGAAGQRYDQGMAWAGSLGIPLNPAGDYGNEIVAVRAYYEPVAGHQLTITTSIDPVNVILDGNVINTPFDETREAGAHTIEAPPMIGTTQFKQWSDGDINNVKTINLTQDMSLHAVYDEIPAPNPIQLPEYLKVVHTGKGFGGIGYPVGPSDAQYWHPGMSIPRIQCFAVIQDNPTDPLIPDNPTIGTECGCDINFLKEASRYVFDNGFECFNISVWISNFEEITYNMMRNFFQLFHAFMQAEYPDKCVIFEFAWEFNQWDIMGTIPGETGWGYPYNPEWGGGGQVSRNTWNIDPVDYARVSANIRKARDDVGAFECVLNAHILSWHKFSWYRRGKMSISGGTSDDGVIWTDRCRWYLKGIQQHDTFSFSTYSFFDDYMTKGRTSYLDWLWHDVILEAAIDNDLLPCQFLGTSEYNLSVDQAPADMSLAEVTAIQAEFITHTYEVCLKRYADYVRYFGWWMMLGPDWCADPNFCNKDLWLELAAKYDGYAPRSTLLFAAAGAAGGGGLGYAVTGHPLGGIAGAILGAILGYVAPLFPPLNTLTCLKCGETFKATDAYTVWCPNCGQELRRG